MPQSCTAVGCTNRYTKGIHLQFFSFPLKNKEKLQKWLNAMHRDNWNPTKYSRICSEHFTPDDYRGPGMIVPYLKEDAVPSVFKAFPAHLQKKPPVPRIRKKRTVEIPCTKVSVLEDQPIVEPEINLDMPPPKKLKVQPSPKTTCLRKKIKVLNQKIRRRNKKISSLKELLALLKKRGLLENHASNIIDNHFDGTLNDIFKNELLNRNKNIKGRRYSRDLKHFALTLLYYSPKAYNFCRSILSLPHPTSVRNWISSVNSEPGFLADVFTELSKLPLEQKDCNLVVDGMAIRKQIIWDRKSHKFIGFCDFGNELRLEGSETPASEALVFMLVALNGKWKWPIGYFLTNKLNATIQSQLIRTALILAGNAGLKIWGVTCDGTNTNYDTLNELGCDLYKTNYSDIRHFFKHPSKGYNVYFVPDACHNLKLARNALGTYKSFISPNGEIKWSYLENLVEMQTKISLKLGNKLGRAHIEWSKNVMKVKLAAQTLSSSVADALDFLESTGVKEFSDCEETVNFIRIIDRIFDFLNSRNPFGKGYKSPLYLCNVKYLEKTMSEHLHYLFNLRDSSGKLLCKSGRKTFIIGLATAIKSVFDIAKNILSTPETKFKYLLTYKFSQDHIELLFGRIRLRFGSNNNPNADQFRTAMKQILMKNSISMSANGNCVALDSDLVGSVFEVKWNRRSSPLIDHELVDESESNDDGMGHQMILNFLSPHLQEVKDNILFYISGYLVKKIINYISCSNCAEMLIKGINEHSYAHVDYYTRFTDTINRGGLLSVSTSVVKIVLEAEHQFLLITKNASNLNLANLDKSIINKIVNKFGLDETVFKNHHKCNLVEIAFEEPHKLQLIKSVAARYLKIRFFAFGQFHSKEIIKPVSKRSQLNKLILFNND